MLEPALKQKNVSEEDFCNRIGDFAKAAADQMSALAKSAFPEQAIAPLAMTAILERLSSAAERQLQNAIIEKFMMNPEIMKKIENVIGQLAKRFGEQSEAEQVAEMVKGQPVN